MMDDLFYRALIAAIGLTLATGPLGCFIVWRRMAYFSDATAHAAILGVAISLVFQVSIYAGVLAIALVLAVIVWSMDGRRMASDTALGVLSHSMLAIGLVAVSLIDGVRVDLEAYLFGDLLAVSRLDVGVIWIGALIILAILYWRWSSLVTATLNSELARASGISAKREGLMITLLTALVVALAIKVVGALLIGALLIIPAASARFLSRTPEQMAFLACLIGVLASLAGLNGAFALDTPAGPTIVCAAVGLFALAGIFGALRGAN